MEKSTATAFSRGLSSRWLLAIVQEAMGAAKVHATPDDLPRDLGLQEGQPKVRAMVLWRLPE